MKTFTRTLGLAAMLALVLFAGQARAQDEQNNGSTVPPNADNNIPQDAVNKAPQSGDNNVSFQTFYDQLADQGTWVQTDKYGYVFQPKEGDSNWRPYEYGHWVNTDAGMTWDSDEPFGWATYHYGRWVNIDGYGWVWVPGYTWAPAWVSWRDSDDYVGWAPLPPETCVGIDFFDPGIFFGFGFHIGDDCDLAYGIGPWCYNFCPVAFIGDSDCWRHFRDPRDNFALIGQTRNITNLNFRRDGAGQFGRVHAGGPSVAALNARSRTPIQQAQLTAASSPAAAGLHGNRLAAFAPRVDPATARTARPGSVSGTLANASVNRGTNINKPLTTAQGLRAANATPRQIHAATLAQGNTSARAKIAGVNAQPSRALNRPLTALQPNPNIGGARSTTTGGAGMRPSASVGANGGAAATGAPTARHTLAPSSAQSSFTGAPTTRHTIAPSRSAEATYTGAPTTRHTLAPSSAQSSFTGAPTTRHTLAPFRSAESSFTGAPTTRHTLAPSSSGGSYGYHPSSAFQSSAPVYHPQSSAPVFHSSAPVYHPQQSFRSVAPASQPHFGGGAPAAHFSGGGMSGGGRSSGGGGAVRSSGGGGQRGTTNGH
jgi:hypothetical protein